MSGKLTIGVFFRLRFTYIKLLLGDELLNCPASFHVEPIDVDGAELDSYRGCYWDRNSGRFRLEIFSQLLSVLLLLFYWGIGQSTNNFIGIGFFLSLSNRRTSLMASHFYLKRFYSMFIGLQVKRY